MLIEEKEYLRDSLYEIFKEIIGEDYELIFEHENGVRPVAPFFSLDLNSVRLLGSTPYYYPGLISDDEKLFNATRQPVERNVVFRGFGKDTEDVVTSISSILSLPSTIDKFANKNLVVPRTENVVQSYSNYSEEEETFFSLPFILSYERIVSEETTYIETVDIEGTLDNRTVDIDIDLKKEE